MVSFPYYFHTTPSTRWSHYWGSLESPLIISMIPLVRMRSICKHGSSTMTLHAFVGTFAGFLRCFCFKQATSYIEISLNLSRFPKQKTTYIWVWIYIYIYIYICMKKYICMNMYSICVYIWIYLYLFIYIYMKIYIHICIYIYIHMYLFFLGVFFGDLLPLGFNSMRQKKTSARCWLRVLPLLPSMLWGNLQWVDGLDGHAVEGKTSNKQIAEWMLCMKEKMYKQLHVLALSTLSWILEKRVVVACWV